mgnify:CR=1 FL=1
MAEIMAIEISGGRRADGVIEPTNDKRKAEFWTIYRRDRYVTGVTLVQAIITFPHVNTVEHTARRLATWYEVPYRGFQTIYTEEEN